MEGRAGGLVCITSINDPTAGFIENLVGYGTALVERYDRQYELRAGEVVIVISNSGKNASPIEVALHAKKKGCIVVVRPDQYVANVLPLDAYDELAAFFDGFMLTP